MSRALDIATYTVRSLSPQPPLVKQYGINIVYESKNLPPMRVFFYQWWLFFRISKKPFSCYFFWL